MKGYRDLLVHYWPLCTTICAVNERNFDEMNAIKRSFFKLEELLEANYKRLNRLNVFPVPDGDTGTNMLLTVRSVNEALKKVQGQAEEAAVLAKTISKAALLGARGNSGVILSQIIQGFVSHLSSSIERVKDPTELVSAWAEALQKAADEARAAVLKPMEGTILTVASSAAKQAVIVSKSAGADLELVIRESLERARKTLAETPNMLEQLKKANVVDSGGAGFVHVLEALYMGFLGKDLPDSLRSHPWLEEDGEGDAYITDEVTYVDPSSSSRGPRYEVMFLLEADSEGVEEMKRRWAEIGDSIVVVGSDGVYNCHIHCDDIGASIESGIRVGSISGIRVSDLYELIGEHAMEVLSDTATESTDNHVHSSVEAGDTVSAMVAVVNGSGLAETLRSVGVDVLVDGGESMNPSTEELLRAISEARGRSVVIFPNSKNVVAAANLAKDLSPKDVEVIPTSSVLQAFSLALDFDPEKTAQENAAVLKENIDEVRFGEITYASRSGVVSSQDVRFEVGEVIGIYRSKVEVASHDLAAATLALCEVMLCEGDELVTLVYGSQVQRDEAEKIQSELSRAFPSLCVDLLYGGQPHYPFLISIE